MAEDPSFEVTKVHLLVLGAQSSCKDAIVLGMGWDGGGQRTEAVNPGMALTLAESHTALPLLNSAAIPGSVPFTNCIVSHSSV